jgi:hypothetical protein
MFVFAINRQTNDNQIDNRLAHHIIAGPGLSFPFDNFQKNQLADFLERRLTDYLLTHIFVFHLLFIILTEPRILWSSFKKNRSLLILI